jgi:hypothetical protein
MPLPSKYTAPYAFESERDERPSSRPASSHRDQSLPPNQQSLSHMHGYNHSSPRLSVSASSTRNRNSRMLNYDRDLDDTLGSGSFSKRPAGSKSLKFQKLPSGHSGLSEDN